MTYRFIFLLALICLASCGRDTIKDTKNCIYPNVVFYEIFVQSFADSNQDSIGDINGIINKLDYLSELGVKGIWLMPVNPSKSYHKYDVMDYTEIDPKYGNLKQFKKLVEKCHQKGIKIIIDLVINHSSVQHNWFKDAKSNTKSKYRDYYVWSSDSAEIQKDRDHWYSPTDSLGKKIEGPLFYAYFSKKMPDLNFDNPNVKQAFFKISEFWLKEMDIDGFRLDAARHIFPENRMSENYSWWADFSKEVRKIKKDAFIVGEVWDTEKAVIPFLNHSLQSAFNFSLSSSILKAIKTEQDSCIVSRLIDYRNTVLKNDSSFLDATFLSNHDQERIMTSIGNDSDKAKLAASILLTLPGVPFIYYGEEIGMLGAKPDKYIREPILWEQDELDAYRTKWMQALFSTTRTVVPITEQAKEPNSLLNHYRRLIKLRNNNLAMSIGELKERKSEVNGILSYYRIYKKQEFLIIHNLSNSSQSIGLEGYDAKFTKTGLRLDSHSFVKPPVVILNAYTSIILTK